jgi:hypothetical protein
MIAQLIGTSFGPQQVHFAEHKVFIILISSLQLPFEKHNFNSRIFLGQQSYILSAIVSGVELGWSEFIREVVGDCQLVILHLDYDNIGVEHIFADSERKPAWKLD